MTKMVDKTHILNNLKKLHQKQVVIQVNIISYESEKGGPFWPPEQGFCQLVQVPCLGGCGPCQGWPCPGRWEGTGCLQGSGLWGLFVTLALFKFKKNGCMKLEEDKTPGTRPERPWLSWSAIDAIYFPFPALISLVLTSFRQVGPTTRSLCLWRSADYESPLPCAASDRWYTEKAWEKQYRKG